MLGSFSGSEPKAAQYYQPPVGPVARGIAAINTYAQQPGLNNRLVRYGTSPAIWTGAIDIYRGFLSNQLKPPAGKIPLGYEQWNPAARTWNAVGEGLSWTKSPLARLFGKVAPALGVAGSALSGAALGKYLGPQIAEEQRRAFQNAGFANVQSTPYTNTFYQDQFGSLMGRR